MKCQSPLYGKIIIIKKYHICCQLNFPREWGLVKKAVVEAFKAIKPCAGVVVGGGNFLYMAQYGCACRIAPIFIAAWYMISSLPNKNMTVRLC